MGASTGDRRVAWPRRSAGARVLIGLVVAVAAGSSACSGDDDTAPTEPVETRGTTSIAATTVVPTTPPPTTAEPETVAPSSDAPDTSMAAPAPSSALATTVAPTTLPATSNNTSDEQDALAVLDGSYGVWRECLRSLTTCDTSSFAKYLADPQLGGDQERIAEWQAQSYEAVNVDTLTYEVLELHLDFTIPYVLVCETDHTAIVDRPAGGPEQVIVQYDGSKVREAQFVRTPDGWRIEGFATRDGESCP